MNRATSLYLDLIRPVAALVVFLSHISDVNLSGGRLAQFSGLGVQAVDVFFVLSGFVIAHVCATRERDASIYGVSRTSRIVSVALPALVLTAVLDVIGMHLRPEVYTDGPYQPFSLSVILRSVSFLGEQWNSHRFPGSNGPYWSLGFEVWYYVAFGALIFAPGRWRWIGAGAVLLFVGPKVAIMFPVWLLGVGLYHLCATSKLSSPIGWCLLVVPVAGLIGQAFLPQPHLTAFYPVTLTPERLATTGRDYLIGLLFATHLLGFSTVSRHFPNLFEPLARPIRWVAGATFSLYLAHLPILHLLAAASPWPKSSDASVALLLIGAPIGCLLFAEVSERRKGPWRAVTEGALARLRRMRVPQPTSG